MINYSTLKQIQKKERNSSTLSNIPRTFYAECSNYFHKLENTDISSFDLRLYHNAFNCYTEIVERRLEKINRKAYFHSISTYKLNSEPEDKDAERPENCLECEYNMFKKLIVIYIDFYKERYEEYLQDKRESDMINEYIKQRDDEI